jgi:phosphatidate cytidylyltransferase
MHLHEGSDSLAELNDLIKRIITGSILICIIIFFLWIDHLLLVLLVLFFITFATNEYFRFWHRKNIYPHTLAILLPGYAIPLLVYFEVPIIFPGFLLFFFICLLTVMRFPGSRREANFLAEIAAVCFGIIYLSLLPSSLIALRKMGFAIALMPLILTWLYDTFAYLVGSLFGRRKLLEKISPKKSWEGTLLAFVLTFPFTFIFSKLWLDSLTVVDVIIITAGIGILGTIGDLLESGMKREAGLKDASSVFPGHGGFLDRLDSLILNIPFFYTYLLFHGFHSG